MAEGAKILVAEDNQLLQNLVRRTLERHGFRVAQAHNGVELFRELVGEKPDLIVLDLGLPDSDGRDLLGMLKRDPKTHRIPVLVWSGRHQHSDRRISLQLGATDFLDKGAPSELVLKIEWILSHLA